MTDITEQDEWQIPEGYRIVLPNEVSESKLSSEDWMWIWVIGCTSVAGIIFIFDLLTDYLR